ncbi:SAV_2336 N-terminal domain-related protein [Streptomyces sp. T12]|uniref:SAV_2336 N-terminal domain-related protein n=2 Tax=unclassified Streptomyces TaxID=2593676 RepID=UPI002366E49E|nr:SAV_2336 N-terminal domain-related protein [Streptomyces sp. T12]WDF38262.1 SAV_2336 N-terminal domain-related protein [Streptomyces sp. T12]
MREGWGADGEGPRRRTPADGADRLGAVLGVLKGAGYDLDAHEVLDVLWLASRLPPDDRELPLRRLLRGAGIPAQPPPPQQPLPDERVTEPDGEAPGSDLPDLTMPELHAAPLPQQLPELPRLPPAADSGKPALPLLVPEEKALRDELVIGRALRPLKRKRPSPRLRELDEAATAAQLAETRLPDVVLRPTRVRWLNLVVVVDDGLSMLLWHRLTAELLTTLQRLGAFRSIQVRGIDTRSVDAPVLRGHPFDPDSSVLSPSVLLDPSGQTLVLVVSDGMGSGWRGGAVHDILLEWAASGPVAVLHTLPPALWGGSGIRADRWQATTRRPGGANTSWHITDRVLPKELAEFTGVPIPVLQPTAASLRTWAELLTSPGTTVELPLLARPWQRGPVAPPREVGSLQHFRDAASPEAYRLAAHLAAVSPVSVPVMRLVQSAVPWEARTTHLAEVFLGGLIHPYPAPVPGPLPAKHRVFDFTEESKTALLDAVPSGELLRTGRRIGRRLEQLAGRSPDFPAWLAHPEGVDRLPAAFPSFTAVERRLMARFGVTVPGPAAAPPPRVVRPPVWNPLTPQDPTRLGHYDLRGRRLGRRTVVYLGVDQRGAEVALRTVRPELPASTAQLLDTEAKALTRLDGRYAPDLLDTGQDGRTRWIAVRLFPSAGGSHAQPPRLSDLLAYVGPDQAGAFDILTSLQLGWHLASALSVCHLNELVPADLSADSVVVLERTVLLTGLADCAVDGEFHGSGVPPTKEGNIRDLGELLRQVSSRPRPPFPGSPEGMHRWSGDTWQPLRELVLRCLDPDPTARPAASEVADKLAQYVAIAQAMRGGAATGAAPPVPERGPAGAPPLTPSPAPPPEQAGFPARRPGVPSRATAARQPSFGRFGNRERAPRLAAVRRPLTRSRRVALVGAQSNSGRVTTTVVLGSLLVALRDQAVLALDGAPAAGDLHVHLPPDASSTPRQLTRLSADAPYEEIRRHTSLLPSGLEVLAHRALRATPSPAYADEYRHIMALVTRHYPVVLTDWAASRLDAPANVVLEHTDQLVVCCTAREDTLAIAGDILDTLRDRGWGTLADRAVVAATLTGVNQSAAEIARSGALDHFPAATVIPYDPHLADPRPIDLTRLKPRTANAFLELAALTMTGPAQTA